MTMNHPANRQALYAATLAHFPQHDVNLQAEAFIAGGRATPLPLIEAATIPSLLLQL